MVAPFDAQASAATWLRDNGATKIAVIDDGTAAGASITKAVAAELGSAVALTDSLPAAPKTAPAGGEDFSAVVAKVTSAQADAVYFAGLSSRGGYLLKQLRASGFAGKVMMAGGTSTPAFLPTAGNAASEGATYTCTCAPPSASAAFEQAYRALFGAVPPDYTAEAFDATTILLQGLAAGVHDRSAMTRYVRDFSGTGICKPQISFDSNGYIRAIRPGSIRSTTAPGFR